MTYSNRCLLFQQNAPAEVPAASQAIWLPRAERAKLLTSVILHRKPPAARCRGPDECEPSNRCRATGHAPHGVQRAGARYSAHLPRTADAGRLSSRRGLRITPSRVPGGPERSPAKPTLPGRRLVTRGGDNRRAPISQMKAKAQIKSRRLTRRSKHVWRNAPLHHH
jgi:hypothetical protein